MELHDLMRKNRYDEDVFSGNALIRMYGDCGAPMKARLVFENLEQHNLFSWNAMLAAYVKQGHAMEALQLFEQMIVDGINPDKLCFLNTVTACITLSSLKHGWMIHAKAVEFGLDMDISVLTTLVKMYDKCRSLEDAISLYCKIDSPDLFLCTALISAYCHHGHGKKATMIFLQVMEQGMKPDTFTLSTILSACHDKSALEDGKFIHDRAIEFGCDADVFLCAALVNMYGKCGSLEDARKTFDSLQYQSLVAWNALMAAYVHHGNEEETLELSQRMRLEGLQPDNFTYSTLFSACTGLGDVEKGRALHTELVIVGLGMNVVSGSALINLYGKCNSLDDAWVVFGDLQKRDITTWNALIAACVQQGHNDEALELFEAMEEENIQPNEISFVSIFAACGNLKALVEGKAIHFSIQGSTLEREANVASSLVNMYGKCGCLVDAVLAFRRISQPDLMSWNALLAAYAQNGHGEETLVVFRNMQEQGLQPDGVTFVSVLAACSHAGLVEEGYRYYTLMSTQHGITPLLEHCGCMIDLFGRAGRLAEAEDFISKMPVDPDLAAWKSLLAACKEFGDTERARYAAERIIELDSSSAPAYILLSNTFAEGRQLYSEVVTNPVYVSE